MFPDLPAGRLAFGPTGDFGVRRGTCLAWESSVPTARELEPFVDPYRPSRIRTVVARYCWLRRLALRQAPTRVWNSGPPCADLRRRPLVWLIADRGLTPGLAMDTHPETRDDRLRLFRETRGRTHQFRCSINAGSP